MVEFTYTVKDPKGIHARPAGVITAELEKFKSDAVVIVNEKIVDLHKVMPFIGSGIRQKDHLTIRVEGEDEKECAEALKKAFAENL